MSGRRRAGFWAVLALLGAGLLVFQNSLAGPFVFDDRSAISENSSIRKLGDLRALLDPPPELAVSGRPLINISFALNYAAGGLQVRGYHLVNLALHLIAALLLCAIMRRTLEGPRLSAVWGDRAPPLAFATALLWLVHPLQTEAVDYLSQRSELLMGLCFFLSLYAMLRAAAAASRPRCRAWQLAGVMACLAGMASKEVMAVCPLLVLLHDSIFISGSPLRALQARTMFYAGLALSWALLAMLVVRGPRAASVGFAHGASSLEYARAQLLAVTQYLRLSLWPHPLVFDYGDWPARDMGSILLPGLLVAALLAATALALWRRPPLGYLGAWVFVTLAPTSSVVPIVTEWAAERRMYLPLAAIVAGLVLGADSLLGRLPAERRRFARALTLAVPALLLGAGTLARNESYRDELVLWREALARRPSNARAWYHIGHVLDRRDAAVALRALQREAAHRPSSAALHAQLGHAYARLRQRDEAERHLSEALRLDPRSVRAYHYLAQLRVEERRLAEGVQLFHRAIALAPRDPALHTALGLALVKGRDLPGARAAFHEALRLRPNDAQARENLEAALRALRARGASAARAQ